MPTTYNRQMLVQAQTGGPNCEIGVNGSITAFQAAGASSSLVFRSIFLSPDAECCYSGLNKAGELQRKFLQGGLSRHLEDWGNGIPKDC